MVKTWVIWDEKVGSVWVGCKTGAFRILVGYIEFEELGGRAPTSFKFSAGGVMVGSNGAGTSMGCAGAS